MCRARASGGAIPDLTSADQAKVSVSLIYNWCADGRLAHYRVGREGRRVRILIAPANPEKVIAECRRSGHSLLTSE